MVLHLTSHLGHFIWEVLGGISDSLFGYFISHLILVTSSDKLWGVYLTAYMVLYLASCLGHFIWEVPGGRGYIWQPIWVLHLTCHLGHFTWQVGGGFIWALHLKTWPNSAICFEWALIDNIDQQRLLLLALAVLYGGYIWKHYLKIWTHFRFDSCFTEVFSMKDQSGHFAVTNTKGITVFQASLN